LGRRVNALVKARAQTTGWAIGLGIAFLLLLLATGWRLVVEYDSAQPPYWMLVSLVLVFGLLVWVFRLLVRAMFSDLHLAEEAKLRSVMTKTYIALLRERAADEKDRQLVLENIYRPMSAGLIGDEIPPTTLGEIIRGFARSK
jgi:hypothetical protein